MVKKYVAVAIGASAAAYLGYRAYKSSQNKKSAKDFQGPHSFSWKPNTRKTTKNNMSTQEYDLLIIGGGSSGSGCALDAVTRGLKVALVEYGDFSSETSSKSTKLLHGGVRYLEKAVKEFSYEQFKLVVEALHERSYVIKISPYLAKSLKIMLPVYNFFYIPYFFAGLVFYDLIAGTKSLGRSFILGKEKTLKEFPKLKSDNLKGSVVYFDAQQNDSRNNLMLCLTAAYYGADVLNYAEVIGFVRKDDLIKNKDGVWVDIKNKNKKGINPDRIIGIKCVDKITGDEFIVKGKGIINTTGPFTDEIRAKSGCNEKIMSHSSGTHIVFPREYSPKEMGVVDPNTSDGRILFIIPWRGKTIVGTTEEKCILERENRVENKEIDFIVKNFKEYVNEEGLRSKILSTWKGIRPLVKDTSKKNTESIARNHVIRDERNGILSLTGGKWTTYRKMAEDAIDKAVKIFNLSPKRECITKHVKILGGIGYEENLYEKIMADLNVDLKTAVHLADTYGTRYELLKKYSKGGFKKLSDNYEFLEEEISYSIDYEMAVKSSDILIRRTGLAFLDVNEARKCLSTVVKKMKSAFDWSMKYEKKDKKETVEALKSYGLGVV